VRLAVVCSVFVHFAVIAAAYRLPSSRRAARAPIEIDIKAARSRPAPVVPPITPPLPRPQLASATGARTRTAPPPAEVAPKVAPIEPMTTQPPSATPEPGSSAATVPQRTGPIDLKLHALPQSPTVERAPTPGAPDGTSKKPWRPRGDAGDPILGKLAERKEEEFPLESLGRDGFIYKGPSFSAHILADGTVSFDDKFIRDFKGLSGGFDASDMIMRAKGEDPYRHEKKKFLAATAEKRAELARRAHQQELQGALAQLPWHCDEIWHTTYKPARERRRLLFALWKETADSEDGLVDVGAEARAIIEKFIRRNLPETSPDAYTPDELAHLNNGSGRKFDPYH
jgi:hypothetical protein